MSYHSCQRERDWSSPWSNLPHFSLRVATHSRKIAECSGIQGQFPSAEMCRGFLCCINFGGFCRGFSWRIFLGTFSPTRMRRKNPARKSAKKSGGPKIKIREKSVLQKTDPKRFKGNLRVSEKFAWLSCFNLKTPYL